MFAYDKTLFKFLSVSLYFFGKSNGPNDCGKRITFFLYFFAKFIICKIRLASLPHCEDRIYPEISKIISESFTAFNK